MGGGSTQSSVLVPLLLAVGGCVGCALMLAPAVADEARTDDELEEVVEEPGVEAV